MLAREEIRAECGDYNWLLVDARLSLGSAGRGSSGGTGSFQSGWMMPIRDGTKQTELLLVPAGSFPLALGKRAAVARCTDGWLGWCCWWLARMSPPAAGAGIRPADRDGNPLGHRRPAGAGGAPNCSLRVCCFPFAVGGSGFCCGDAVQSLLGIWRVRSQFRSRWTCLWIGRVLLFTVSLSIVTGIVFGLLPALRAFGPNSEHALLGWRLPARIPCLRLNTTWWEARSQSSLVLLVAATVPAKLQNASSIPLWHEREHVLMLGFDARGQGNSNDRAVALFRHCGNECWRFRA